MLTLEATFSALPETMIIQLGSKKMFLEALRNMCVGDLEFKRAKTQPGASLSKS